MRFYITSASWNGEAVLIEHFQMIEVDYFGAPIEKKGENYENHS